MRNAHQSRQQKKAEANLANSLKSAFDDANPDALPSQLSELLLQLRDLDEKDAIGDHHGE